MMTYETELMHHGVKGMKWGHRKQQKQNSYLNMYKTTKKAARAAGEKGVVLNRRQIKQYKKGRKIAAKRGDSIARKEIKAGRVRKQTIAAVGAGLAAAHFAKGAMKYGNISNNWKIMGDIPMAKINQSMAGRRAAAGIIAAASSITLASLAHRNRKIRDNEK